MTTERKRKKSAVKLRIEGEMSIYQAGELKRTLHAPVANGVVLEVDLSAVTELDTSGLQLLVLAKKAAQARQGELRLVACSPAVLEVFDLLDLGAYFDVPSAASARGMPAARSPSGVSHGS